jgi:PAS domain S-box-containing protein
LYCYTEMPGAVKTQTGLERIELMKMILSLIGVPALTKYQNTKLYRYLISITLVLLTLLINNSFAGTFLQDEKFLFLYPTMFLISYLFGMGPSLLSLTLSSTYVFIFLMPSSQAEFLEQDHALSLFVYVTSSLFVARVTQKGYRSDRALKRNNEILRDLLTSQREVMREMKAAEERLRLATSVSKVGIWEWNLINSEFTTTLQHDLCFGYKEKCHDWNYVTFKSHLHPLDREKVTQAIDNAISSCTDFEMDFRIMWNDGATRWIRKFGKVESALDGSPTRVIGTCTDITEQKKSEDAMKEALFYRDEFLSIASHELKTPLTSLKLQSQVYKRGVLRNDSTIMNQEKLSSIMGNVDVQVNRLVRLVDDMLDIFRIRTGNLSIIKEMINLNQLISDVIERARPQYNIPHLITFRADSEFEILGDLVRIDQVVTNLLSNAMRYGKGAPIEVSLSQTHDRNVLIRVKDNGIGISPIDQFRIFNRFQRAVPAREVSGLGLGLYIAQEIVKSHGGKISVESEMGKGSVFLVHLPVGTQS